MDGLLSLNRRQLLQRLAGAAALAGVAPAALALPAATPSQRLARLGESFYREVNALFPLAATENLGDPAYEAALEVDIAPVHLRRQRRFYRRIADEARRIDPARLTPDERLSRDLLAHEAAMGLTLLDFPGHLLPVGHMGSLPVRLAEWASGKGPQPMQTVANYEHFLRRLGRLPGWIRQAIVNMEQGMAKGVVLPRPLVERTLPQLDALLPENAELSPYLAGVRAFPDTVPAADQRRLAVAYRKLVATRLAPAVQRLRAFMRDRYLPQAAAAAGISALPRGGDWYRALVRLYTTTDLTPAQIHDIGLREVERVRAELERVKAQFRFDGPLNAFLQSLGKRPELTPFRSQAEVLAAYEALNGRVAAALPALFERAPRAALQIRAVDAMSQDTASDYYIPPATDGSRPGTFFAVITDPARYSTTRMTALFLHEGQPGHHYQIGLQQELKTPRFRKLLWYAAHGEGWALYAESLGRELGLYDDANAWLGRLLMELHRSLRLVVDTGLHTKGWTREQTMAYLREHEGSSEEAARRATERYMAWPGQALAYKLGELKLQELRDRARQKLGPRFDIRKFHTQLLDAGTLPLQLLEARIDAWIAATA